MKMSFIFIIYLKRKYLSHLLLTTHILNPFLTISLLKYTHLVSINFKSNEKLTCQILKWAFGKNYPEILMEDFKIILKPDGFITTRHSLSQVGVKSVNTYIYIQIQTHKQMVEKQSTIFLKSCEWYLKKRRSIRNFNYFAIIFHLILPSHNNTNTILSKYLHGVYCKSERKKEIKYRIN